MAAKSCTSCFRTFQRQSRSIVHVKASIQLSNAASNISKTRRTPLHVVTSRAFATSKHGDVPLPEPSTLGTPATSNRPVTKETAPSETLHVPKTGGITGAYSVYGVTETLYQECASQADYTIPQAKDDDAEMPKTEDGEDLGVGSGWWHTELGLKPTFSTWSQVTMLHMYILSARFRNLSTDPQPWLQHLLDHFSYDAENKMTILHNMHARGTRNKYLKDLFIQWRGLLAAYDEGLAKNDAVLAAAIWRNVFKANEDIDVKGLAQVVSYLRRALKGLDGLSDEKVTNGEVGFGSPKVEEVVVKLRSAMLDLPFDKAPGKDLPSKISKG